MRSKTIISLILFTANLLLSPLIAQYDDGTKRKMAHRFTKAEQREVKQLSHADSWAYQKLLLKAIEAKNISAIKKYIAAGANPFARSEMGYGGPVIRSAFTQNCKPCIQAMHYSIEQRLGIIGAEYALINWACAASYDMCRFIFEEFPSLDANADGLCSITGKCKVLYPLAKLTGMVDKKVLPFLIENGCDPNAGHTSPWRAYAAGSINLSDTTSLIAFLESGSDPNIYTHPSRTLLYLTIKHERYDLTRLLLLYGADLNLCQEIMPLEAAIRQNKFGKVKWLIENGAKVNYQNCLRSRKSSLDVALSRDTDERIIDFLIENGAR